MSDGELWKFVDELPPVQPTAKGQTMTYNEIWDAFTKMSINDQQRFIDSAKNLVRMQNTSLRAGARVCFKHTKTGAMIDGVFVRMRQKYAEVETTKDKYGIDMGRVVKWTVPPEMLRMVTM